MIKTFVTLYCVSKRRIFQLRSEGVECKTLASRRGAGLKRQCCVGVAALWLETVPLPCMAAPLLAQWQWARPPVYERLRGRVRPKDLRHFAGGIVKVMRGEDVIRCGAEATSLLSTVEAVENTSVALAWQDVEEWLHARGHAYALEGARPLESLWLSGQDEWPPNLQVAAACNENLVLPEAPPQKRGDEEWRFYPTHYAPPVAAEDGSCVHKSVPRWGKGWQLQWHGTSVYGAINSLAMGELLPSEPEGKGHATACGRGVYTSRSFSRAARYGISHYFPQDSMPHGYVCKMLLLTGVPGEAPEALPLAEWVAVHRSGLSASAKKRTAAWALNVEDKRLDRKAMREMNNGQAREQDWTSSAHESADQYTSSRGYVLGLAVGLMRPSRARKYLQEGKMRMATRGYVAKAELPFARPIA